VRFSAFHVNLLSRLDARSWGTVGVLRWKTVLFDSAVALILEDVAYISLVPTATAHYESNLLSACQIAGRRRASEISVAEAFVE